MEDILTQIRPMLMTTPERWKQLAQQWPAELLALSPAPGEWSPMQCLQHILDNELVYQSRVKAFLEGRDFGAVNPARDMPVKDPSPSVMADEFARRREDTLRLLLTLTPTDLGRSARHSELGPVTLEQMLHTWVAHDLNHTLQAEEALMQPFIHACGPWRKYFTAHIAQA